MESTGILVSTSRPADNVHLAPSICNAPVRFLESRSVSSGQSKSQSQKRTLVQPIRQTLFLLQSRSAPKSVSVYGSRTEPHRVVFLVYCNEYELKNPCYYLVGHNRGD